MTTIRTYCDKDGPCSFHADGAPPEEKCTGMCDAEDCRALGLWVVAEGPPPFALEDGEGPAFLCTAHLLAVVSERRTMEWAALEDEKRG